LLVTANREDKVILARQPTAVLTEALVHSKAETVLLLVVESEAMQTTPIARTAKVAAEEPTVPMPMQVHIAMQKTVELEEMEVLVLQE
jgi:hypothetical protein